MALRGFSILEMVIVIVLISVLMAFGITRLLPYIDEAERIGVLTLESRLRSTLMLVAAKRIAGGQAARIAELEGSNPMTLLLLAPANYVGELSSQDTKYAPRRNWYFNLATRRLIYNQGLPLGGTDKQEWAANPEFEIKVSFDDRNANGVFDPGTDEFFGVRLNRAAGGEWLAGKQQAGQLTQRFKAGRNASTSSY